jgi:hypothetical protein
MAMQKATRGAIDSALNRLSQDVIFNNGDIFV